MGLDVRNEGNATVLTPEGKLSLGPAVDEFRAKWSEALKQGTKNIVVNLTKVPMIDSSGIGSLIRCHSALQAAGGKLMLVGANDVVKQAFRVTRLDRVFEFHETDQSALAAVSASASA